MPKMKVYSQLTLAADLVTSLLPGSDVAPPIARRDLPLDIQHGYQVVVIIDGRFHHSAAVSCDEIMDALRCGLLVVGAASMGALRAAELSDCGMIGIGRIFDFIKRSDWFRDDFVAQTFAESGDGVKALTTPFIDTHFALQQLFESGEASQSTCDAIRTAAMSLHYTERSPDIIKDTLFTMGLGTPPIVDVVERVAKMESQKYRDAVSALVFAREYLERVDVANVRLDEALCRHAAEPGRDRLGRDD